MKKNSQKYLPLLGIALIISVIGFFLFKAGNEEFNDSVITELIPEQGLKDIRFLNDSDDGTKWEIKADDVRQSEDGTQVQFNRFKLRLESSNKLSIEMEGDRADYNRSDEEIVFTGGLKGSTAKGYLIDTEKLVYKLKKDCLESNEEVRVTGPFFVVTGRGLHVDLEKESLKILSNVNALIEKDLLDL